MTIDGFERELRALAADVDFPATPDLAASVARALARPVRVPSPLLRRFVLVAAMVLGAAAVSYAASSRLRDTIRDWLGTNAVEIDRVETLPPLPLMSSDARPSLANAVAALGQPLLLPARLGTPDTAQVEGRRPNAAVTLGWRPRRGLPEARRSGLGLVINEVLGSVEAPFARKLVGPATKVSTFLIEGRRAVGLVGAPHQVAFKDPSGEFTVQRTRLAVNTLLVSHGSVLVRIEADVPLARLIAIDRSLK